MTQQGDKCLNEPENSSNAVEKYVLASHRRILLTRSTTTRKVSKLEIPNTKRPASLSGDSPISRSFFTTVLTSLWIEQLLGKSELSIERTRWHGSQVFGN